MAYRAGLATVASCAWCACQHSSQPKVSLPHTSHIWFLGLLRITDKVVILVSVSVSIIAISKITS